MFHGINLRFLGYIITNGTISPDPQCSSPFLKFPVPTTLKQHERFIGLAVYYAKWVPHFSRVMGPLFSALQSKSLPLSAAALKAIQQVKQFIKLSYTSWIPKSPSRFLPTPQCQLSVLYCHKKDIWSPLCPNDCLQHKNTCLSLN